MYEIALLGSQAVAIALIASWLTIGAMDNIRHPTLNGAVTAEVMEMTRMQAAYPEDFALVAHRALTNKAIQGRAFMLVVLTETIVAVLLWLGALALAASLAGLIGAGTARGLAIMGATGFTAIWAGFLIVGNYFCYWYCHEGAQNTHYQMTLWGLGTTILVAIG